MKIKTKEHHEDITQEELELLSKVYSDKNARSQSDILYSITLRLSCEGYHMDVLLGDNLELLGICIWKHDRSLGLGDFIRVDTLVVSEQGKGYGSKLLSRFDSRKITIDILVDNTEGQRFYEARNFKRRAYSYVK